MLGCRASWLTSYIVWYHSGLWSYHRFYIVHADFDLTLHRTKMAQYGRGEWWCIAEGGENCSLTLTLPALSNATLSREHAWTCSGPHRIAPFQISSVLCQCGQHKQTEAYAPNTLLCCADSIWSLPVHQSEHYFVRAQCGQLFCRFCFCCLGGEQVYFMLFWINFFMEFTLTFQKIIIRRKIWINFKIGCRVKEFMEVEGEKIECREEFMEGEGEHWEEHLGGCAGTYSQGGGGIEEGWKFL